MIIIGNEYETSQNLDNIVLKKEFDKIKNKTLNRKSLVEISLVYEMIEQNPNIDILDELIFGPKNYHILIKHDALIRAIELGYLEIINKVVLFSSNVDLIKTALNYIYDDTLLKLLILGANTKLSSTKRQEIQSIALVRIVDEKIFSEAIRKGYSKVELSKIFRKINLKSSFKALSSLQKRIIPHLITLLPHNYVYNEFSRYDKYPKTITDLIMK